MADARYPSLMVEARIGRVAGVPTSCSVRIDGAAVAIQSSDGSPERFSKGRKAMRLMDACGFREHATMVRAPMVRTTLAANRRRERIRGPFAPSP